LNDFDHHMVYTRRIPNISLSGLAVTGAMLVDVMLATAVAILVWRWKWPVAAVSGALRLDPLAFVPLLLKANLLDRKGEGEAAGETYGHALAQLPDEVPPHLAQMVAEARRRHAAHVEAVGARHRS